MGKPKINPSKYASSESNDEGCINKDVMNDKMNIEQNTSHIRLKMGNTICFMNNFIFIVYLAQCIL
jgi:hypothetical protein